MGNTVHPHEQSGAALALLKLAQLAADTRRNGTEGNEWQMLATVTPAADTISQQRTNRILIIDDDSIARTAYLRYLRGDEQRSYSAVEAGTAEDGTRLLAEEHFDCVVLDYHLPGADGLTVLQSLRDADFGNASLTVVMMTGHGNEDVAVAAMKLGVADYLHKEGLTALAFQRAIGNAMDRSALRTALRRKSERLEQVHAELQQQTAELQRFYHTVSHELKTPLCAVREFVALVRDGVAGAVDSPEQQKFLDYALNGCDLMARQVNDLLDSARSDTDRLQLSLSETAVDRCCEFAVAAMHHAALAKGLELTLSVAVGLPPVMADEGRLAQILANLLANALKFTDRGGRVGVTVGLSEELPGGVEIAVSDSGCGIAAAHLEHVCERLYQVPDAQQRAGAGGLGLGLAIVKDLVERHGGRLRIASTPGVGSTFRFTLPGAHTGLAALRGVAA